jgi:hypothetical protein
MWSERPSPLPLRFAQGFGSLAQGQALSPFASLRGNSAKGLARRTHRSFATLRMTAWTPIKPAYGKPSLHMSNLHLDFL